MVSVNEALFKYHSTVIVEIWRMKKLPEERTKWAKGAGGTGFQSGNENVMGIKSPSTGNIVNGIVTAPRGDRWELPL